MSTHVLDTGRGEPARGVRVELLRGEQQVGTGETNDDGHYHVPLLVSPYGCASYRGS